MENVIGKRTMGIYVEARGGNIRCVRTACVVWVVFWLVLGTFPLRFVEICSIVFLTRVVKPLIQDYVTAVVVKTVGESVPIAMMVNVAGDMGIDAGLESAVVN